ncbi:MAG TPA: hypothetical protein PJ982_09730, partial [Lacipirellulaceae bacterium]|nr:hypothetical protein [Lacipirellulaceae bacterium]
RARTLLEALVERAPRQAVPQAWLAKWHVLKVQQGWSTDPAEDAGRALALTRLALDTHPECTLSLAVDGFVELTILRDGESQIVRVPVQADRDLLIPPLKDQYPEYFIYGPLVFSAATQEYVRGLGSTGLAMLLALDSPMLKRLQEPPSEPEEQLVIVASRVFPHPIAKGYDNRPLGVIESMNGEPVTNLRRLAEMLRDCQDEYIRFEMADRSESLVFRTAQLRESTEEVLTDEGIRYQSSESLRDVFAE